VSRPLSSVNVATDESTHERRCQSLTASSGTWCDMLSSAVFAIIAIPGDQASNWAYIAVIPIGGLVYLIHPHTSRGGADRAEQEARK